VIEVLAARLAVVGTPVLVERPAVAGTPVLVERPAVAGAAARDVIRVAVKDAIEVGELGVAGEAATDAGPPVDAAGVADESPVRAGFVAARGEPAVELVASEVASEAEPDASEAAVVEWGEPRVGRVAFAAGLDGFRAGLVEWAARQGDCPDELLVDLDEFRAGPVG
jgi:hypothetical protein